MGLSAHQSSVAGTTTWLTPPEILAALGEFDLDPCAAPSPRPWPTARQHIELPADGLAADWHGRVWLNPPFDRYEAPRWLAKLAAHGNGIALIPARTETAMFFAHVWPKASGVLFVQKRPHFHYPDGTRAAANSGAPICLVAYGKENATMLEQSGLGHYTAIDLAMRQPGAGEG